jgi:Cu(I)/Ag(I) efflux system membrane fusion protein
MTPIPFLLPLIALLACDASAPSGAAEAASASEAVAEAPTSDVPAPQAKPCCPVPSVQAVVSTHVALVEAMAADDAAATATAWTAFTGAVDLAAADIAITAEHKALASTLLGALQGVDGAALDATRAGFAPVADATLALARAHVGGGELLVSIGFCPMAPGRWLQDDVLLANPYYGASMLRCGVFEGL